MNVNTRQITLARESRGMTQKQLAAKLSLKEIDQADLSRIERGQLDVTESTLGQLSIALNYPKDFFFEDDVRPALSDLYYRKQYKLSGNALKGLRAKIAIITRAISHLMEDIEMERVFEKIRFDLDEGGWNPHGAARYTREILGIPQGPIKNLIEYIEKAGFIVYFTNFTLDGFDGAAAFTESGWPILFVNGSRSNDRLRMNIAHELGHASMHIPFVIDPARNTEQETKVYAGEFLMPALHVKSDLVGLTYHRLHDLKEYWNVSKAAIIQRAYAIGTISKGTYIYLRGELSKAGELKQEKGFVDLDKPTLLNKIIQLHRDAGTHDEELAELTRLSTDDFRNYFIRDGGPQLRLKRMSIAI